MAARFRTTLGRELDVGVVEDGVDLELAPERFDVTLEGREPDVDLVLDSADIGARRSEAAGNLRLGGTATPRLPPPTGR
jgi:hypothetical protein